MHAEVCILNFCDTDIISVICRRQLDSFVVNDKIIVTE